MADRSMEVERGLTLSSFPTISLDGRLSGGVVSDGLVGGEWTRGGVGGREV